MRPHPIRVALSALLAAVLAAGCASTDPSGVPEDESPLKVGVEAMPEGGGGAEGMSGEEAGPRHGPVAAVLLYLPNRIFDLLDVVRARVRVGPGLAVDARVTEVADVFVGSYESAFVGVPGPRRWRRINWPFGAEGRSGVEVSELAKETFAEEHEPRHDPLEIGVGAQILILGFAVGLAPVEIVDFFTGLVGIDLVDDDL